MAPVHPERPAGPDSDRKCLNKPLGFKATGGTFGEIAYGQSRFRVILLLRVEKRASG